MVYGFLGVVVFLFNFSFFFLFLLSLSISAFKAGKVPSKSTARIGAGFSLPLGWFMGLLGLLFSCFRYHYLFPRSRQEKF